jgi:hypothetical protein
MDDRPELPRPPGPRWASWAGYVLIALIALVFAASATMKLRGGPELSKQMSVFGLPERLITPIAVVELSCLILYLVPPTSVLGAILLTGYLGGAVCTNLRVGDPWFAPVVIGALVWLGLYLRDDRLRALIPLRGRRVIPGP